MNIFTAIRIGVFLLPAVVAGRITLALLSENSGEYIKWIVPLVSLLFGISASAIYQYLLHRMASNQRK